MTRPTVPERDPETLELFIDESVEGLARIENLLLEAEHGRAPGDIMATLFRDIHTIKGTSGFLALGKIQSLAHAAEDLLSLLRDKTMAARPDHFSALVSVVDALRAMIELVRANNDEGDTDVAPLIARLRVLEREGDAGAAATATPAAAPAPAPVAASPPPTLAPSAAAAPTPAASAPPSAAAAQAATEGGEERDVHKGEAREQSDGTVRVNVAVLDRLINLIGELVLARNQMMQLGRTVEQSTSRGAQQAYQRLNVVTSELQEQVMKTRMQPVSRVFERIPRMVRDLCKTMGKQVSVQLDGTSTEIDRALVEAIRDPIMHMIRNALDHGIETPADRVAAGKPPSGRLAVRASHEAGTVVIEISDDGRGMQPAKLRAHAVRKGVITAAEAERMTDRDTLDLVFRAGFSTAEKVTDVSGRGVGMDVVRTHVERAGGQVELQSQPGAGTTIRLKMPLTLAIIPALLVQAAQLRFAIPQVNLLELVHVGEDAAATAIEAVHGSLIYRLRGELLPLIRLSSVLGLPSSQNTAVSVVVINAAGRRCGLVVDTIHDTEEIVIKPLSGTLKRLGCYAGATVLGDGGVALVLDVAGVAQMSGIELSTSQRPHSAAGDSHQGALQRHLVFEAGDGARCAVPLAMVTRLERVPAAKIERVGGREVVQYRDRLLPVVRPEVALPIGSMAPIQEQPIVVFDLGAPIGLAVSSIVDVTDLTVPDSDDDLVPFTLGKAVCFGRTTLIIDVFHLMRHLAPDVARERRRAQRQPRVLVADDSEAMRAALTGFLRSQGMEVIDVASGDLALREVRAGLRLDAVVTDLEMPGTDGFGVLDALHAERPELPVFMWTQRDADEIAEDALKRGARACVGKHERELLLEAFEGAGVMLRRRTGDRRHA